MVYGGEMQGTFYVRSGWYTFYGAGIEGVNSISH